MVFLPRNSTDLTQPLDVAFFRPLKEAWRNILFKWKKGDGRKEASIPKSIFPSLLKKTLRFNHTKYSAELFVYLDSEKLALFLSTDSKS